MPAASTPAAAVRIDTSTPVTGRLHERDLRHAVAQRARGALDAQRHVDALGGVERRRGADQLRMAAGEIDVLRNTRFARPARPARSCVPVAAGSSSVTTWRSRHSSRTSSCRASARRWPPAAAVRPGPYTNAA